MAGARILFLVGFACLAVSVHAQTDVLGALAAIPPIDSLDKGSYLVNGTGIVYDKTKITLYVNGVPISYLPLDKASAPGPSKSIHDHDHDDKDDEDKDHEDDDDKDSGLPEDKLPKLPEQDKTPEQALAPGADPHTMEPMLPKGSDDKPENPLYGAVIGRKLKL